MAGWFLFPRDSGWAMRLRLSWWENCTLATWLSLNPLAESAESLKKPGKRSFYLLCESSSTKIMANKPQILDSNFATALKAKLICQDCQRNPRPNIPLYNCPICQIYKCETCKKISKSILISKDYLQLFLNNKKLFFSFIRIYLY